ncbi:hypothetical protein [[Mycoplasma] gypis]|uniref:Uncharacterized protein n=1 Tax=[Mycoplasma] gypis TaxID=92404 RepID=A0ABZ2RR97_9BACT|nr:hypothetical protein [[Mycoplasma] gypis]MBN0919138.1 hypothetical protein [[Mycoplasma] gypis]
MKNKFLKKLPIFMASSLCFLPLLSISCNNVQQNHKKTDEASPQKPGISNVNNEENDNSNPSSSQTKKENPNAEQNNNSDVSDNNGSSVKKEKHSILWTTITDNAKVIYINEQNFKQARNVNITFNVQEMMNKKISVGSLENQNLEDVLKYVKSINFVDFNGNEIANWTKNSKTINIKKFQITKNNQNQVFLFLSATQKVLNSSNEVIEKEIFHKSQINLKNVYTEEEYLNYLLQNKISIKNTDNSEQFASFFEARNNKNRVNVDLVYNFLTLDENYELKDGLRYFLSSKMFANDIDGSLEIIAQVFNEDKYDQRQFSTTKTFKITGFKQINPLELQQNLLVTVSAEFKHNSKKAFTNYQKANNKKIWNKDEFYKLIFISDWPVIKSYEDSDTKITTTDKKSLLFYYKHHRFFEKFNSDDGLLNNEFQIKYLNITFDSIHIKQVDEDQRRMDIEMFYTIYISIDGKDFEFSSSLNTYLLNQ